MIMRHLKTLRRSSRWTLGLCVALPVVLIALAAGAMLGMLSRMPRDRAHVAAAERLLLQGTELTRYLGGLSMLRDTNLAAIVWQRLPFLVDGLHSAQSGLQYVEITRDGVTVFHRQTGRIDGSHPPAATSMPVRISRHRVERFGRRIPVVVFRQELPQPDGSLMAVEVGMRREAVELQEQASRQAVRHMRQLALLTLLLAFGLSLTVVIWALRRDRQRDERRRQEEHLVFSGMVANGIVHDFRNPMSAVRLDAQMLAREAHRPEGARCGRLAELAERIGRTLDRMDAIFKEFLFMSRPATAAVETFDLKRCAAECLESMAARLEQGGQRALLQAPDGQAPVHASEPAVRRALVNVLYNAVQHAPRDSAIEVGIAAESRFMAAPRRWLLEVRDRGPGIPPRERERVFEMFTTSRPGGTGLGLFLARAAVVNCGGEIRALGREGGGTIIRMALPMATEEQDATPAADIES